MKNKDWGRGRGGGGLNREGGLLTFLLWKGGLIREEGLFEGGGGLIEDLRYSFSTNHGLGAFN